MASRHELEFEQEGTEAAEGGGASLGRCFLIFLREAGRSFTGGGGHFEELCESSDLADRVPST